MAASIHLACPNCGETNLPGRSPQVEVQRNGICFCNQCGRTFVPEEK